MELITVDIAPVRACLDLWEGIACRGVKSDNELVTRVRKQIDLAEALQISECLHIETDDIT